MIEVTAVTKAFGPTQALADVSMSVASGEARALLGRNGAGKSTLVSLLTGLDAPDRGRVVIADGVPSAGSGAVACVYQRSRLVPGMTVAENVMLSGYPRRFGRTIDWRALHEEAERHLAAWELGHLTQALVAELDPVHAKVVEVCKALTSRPRVLLLDEPTAGLDRRDAERLFAVVDRLKAQGVTLVYVSHHLHEVYRLCDSATVLRDARHVVTAPLGELPMRDLVTAMVGDDAPAEFTEHVTGGADRRARIAPARPRAQRATRLRAEHLAVAGAVEPFDLDVRGGECVGIAGLEGSGKSEIGHVLAGLLEPTAGTVTVDGRCVAPGDVRAALRAGVAYVPEDRHARGLVAELSVSENATMTAARRLVRRPAPGVPGVLRTRDRDRVYERLARQWQIVASSPRQPAGELSGGNQQKCVMARALGTEPAVLVLHNPTAGIDVAAKASIMSTLEEILANGACALVISEDPDDFALCSRILVIVKGRITRAFEDAWTEADLVSATQGEDQ